MYALVGYTVLPVKLAVVAGAESAGTECGTLPAVGYLRYVMRFFREANRLYELGLDFDHNQTSKNYGRKHRLTLLRTAVSKTLNF